MLRIGPIIQIIFSLYFQGMDLSEIQVNFDLEENEMRIFNEDETMMSNSVASDLSKLISPATEDPPTGVRAKK